MITSTVKITNNTNQEYKFFKTFQDNITWDYPETIAAGQTVETTLTFLGNIGESCYGLLRYTAHQWKDFQIRATADTQYQIETKTSLDVQATPTGIIPVVDQETLIVSFEEIAQKKEKPCSSKKDAKKAKESKSKGKRLT